MSRNSKMVEYNSNNTHNREKLHLHIDLFIISKKPSCGIQMKHHKFCFIIKHRKCKIKPLNF